MLDRSGPTVAVVAGLGLGLALAWRVCTRATGRRTGSAVAAEVSAPGTGESRKYTFYVSPHEISRIPNLIEDVFSRHFRAISAKEIAAGEAADFVWLHKATKATEKLRESAAVCSLLSGFEVMEDKRNLALLQQRMQVPTLESYVCETPDRLESWCRRQFGEGGGSGMWMVKDAGGNGGDGLWVLTRENWVETVAQVEQHSSSARSNAHLGAGPIVYVVQKYVERPLLWPDGCKFHFRCYVVLTATMDFYIYRNAFAHVANKPFGTSYATSSIGSGGNGFDREVHITNCSQNIHDASQFHRYPQVDLQADYPVVWEKMIALFADLARCAAPFMAKQLSADHFCHIGADIIADEDGTPWLIEANCPPNLYAYTNEPDHPDEKAITPLIRAMLSDLMRLFVLPVVTKGTIPAEAGRWQHVPRTKDGDGVVQEQPWQPSTRTSLAMNTLALASYKRRMRKAESSIIV